ncbi:MAG: hypothetical protein ACK54K_01855, partial [Gemmatimonadaceae bacterium]
MTEPDVVSIQEVRELVAERLKYDDWLEALEARRADTPARVFDRVYADYVGRRTGVLERLHGYIAPLSGFAQELDRRLEKLEGRLTTLADERAEALLRTAVGEFDQARWEAVREQVEAQIAALGGQREVLQTEVDEVRALLASARAEPGAAATVTTRPATEPAT